MDRAELIERYRTGYRAVEEALEGITDQELDRRPAPGEWSPREVVHHLADSEMRSALRLRQLLAEDDPEIQSYDEEAWARRLHYDRPIEGSLAAFRAARGSTVPLLERLTDEEWRRAGRHPEHAGYTVDDWLQLYAAHGHDHAEQIRAARA